MQLPYFFWVYKTETCKKAFKTADFQLPTLRVPFMQEIKKIL